MKSSWDDWKQLMEHISWREENTQITQEKRMEALHPYGRLSLSTTLNICFFVFVCFFVVCLWSLKVASLKQRIFFLKDVFLLEEKESTLHIHILC